MTIGLQRRCSCSTLRTGASCAPARSSPSTKRAPPPLRPETGCALVSRACVALLQAVDSAQLAAGRCPLNTLCFQLSDSRSDPRPQTPVQETGVFSARTRESLLHC